MVMYSLEIEASPQHGRCSVDTPFLQRRRALLKLRAVAVVGVVLGLWILLELRKSPPSPQEGHEVQGSRDSAASGGAQGAEAADDDKKQPEQRPEANSESVLTDAAAQAEDAADDQQRPAKVQAGQPAQQQSEGGTAAGGAVQGQRAAASPGLRGHHVQRQATGTVDTAAPDKFAEAGPAGEQVTAPEDPPPPTNSAEPVAPGLGPEVGAFSERPSKASGTDEARESSVTDGVNRLKSLVRGPGRAESEQLREMRALFLSAVLEPALALLQAANAPDSKDSVQALQAAQPSLRLVRELLPQYLIKDPDFLQGEDMNKVLSALGEGKEDAPSELAALSRLNETFRGAPAPAAPGS